MSDILQVPPTQTNQYATPVSEKKILNSFSLVSAVKNLEREKKVIFKLFNL